MAKMTAEDRRFTAKLVSLIMTGALVLVALLMYFNLAFGWFAKNEEVGGNGASVQSRGVVFPDIRAWRFDMSQDGGQTFSETGEDFNKAGVWVDALDTDTDDAHDLISVEERPAADTTNREKFRYISLHLGTVDNLLDLSDDNCFYLRLDMTAEMIAELGASVSASYTTEDMIFYSNDGAEVTEQELGATYGLLLDLIDMDCAVSATAYDMTTAADAAAVEALFTTPVTGEGATVTADTDYLQIPRDGTDAVVYAPASATAYYLYVRLRPDLATCFDATHDISQYMPCQLLFDIGIQFGFSR